MAGIYDTHCHLNDNIYIENEISSAEMTKEAKINGVDFINNVGYDIKSSKVALVQAQKNKNVFALVGIHPTQAHLYTDEALETLNTLAHADKVVGIGETGLDYFRDGQKYKDQQLKFLRAHIKIAKKMKLALSLHIKDKEGSIEAYKDVLKILKEENYFKAVVHSFHSTLEVAQMFMDKGIFISINGHVTKDKQLQKVVKELPLNLLVVESDAPYETPKPYAKKTNAPKYIGLVVDWIASIKNISKENIAEITADNAKKIFWK